MREKYGEVSQGSLEGLTDCCCRTFLPPCNWWFERRKCQWTHQVNKKERRSPRALFSEVSVDFAVTETNRVFAVPVAALSSEYSTISIWNAIQTYVNNTKWLYYEPGKTGIQKREIVMAHVHRRPPAALEIQTQRDGPVTYKLIDTAYPSNGCPAAASLPGEDSAFRAPFLACFGSVSAQYFTPKAHHCRVLPCFSVFCCVSPVSVLSPYGMLFFGAFVTDTRHTSEKAGGSVRNLTENTLVFYLVPAHTTCYADRAQGPGKTASVFAGTFPRAFVTWNKYASVYSERSVGLHHVFSACVLLFLSTRKGINSMIAGTREQAKTHSDKHTFAELESQAQGNQPVTQLTGPNRMPSIVFLARFWCVSSAFLVRFGLVLAPFMILAATLRPGGAVMDNNLKLDELPGKGGHL